MDISDVKKKKKNQPAFPESISTFAYNCQSFLVKMQGANKNPIYGHDIKEHTYINDIRYGTNKRVKCSCSYQRHFNNFSHEQTNISITSSP